MFCSQQTTRPGSAGMQVPSHVATTPPAHWQAWFAHVPLAPHSADSQQPVAGMQSLPHVFCPDGHEGGGGEFGFFFFFFFFFFLASAPARPSIVPSPTTAASAWRREPSANNARVNASK